MKKEDVRITVVGTGQMGYYHTRLLSRMGYLDSIIDTNALTAKSVGEQFDIPWYSSLEAIIEERDPNGIILAIPTKIHHTKAIEVIEAFPNLKALLIEKPIASSVEKAVELKSKLDKTSIKVIIGHIEVYNPVITRIQELMNKGILGNLRSALFQRRGAVSEERIESIGDVYEDIGVHDFDVVSRLVPKGNIQLYSSALKLNNVDNSSTTVISSEKENFFVTLLMSREYAGKMRTIDIEGSRGTLCANLLTQIIELRSLEVSRGEKRVSAISVPFTNGEQIKVYGEPLLQETWNFIDCIRGEDNPVVSIDDGIKALKLVEAARKSIKDRMIVQLQI